MNKVTNLYVTLLVFYNLRQKVYLLSLDLNLNTDSKVSNKSSSNATSISQIWLSILYIYIYIYIYKYIYIYNTNIVCMYIYTIHINKIYSSKYADQLSLWIWINKTNYEWCDKESYFCWIFIIDPDYFFTGNIYSWISHANLARWWWRSSKISLRTVVDLAFFLHVM